jgi:hypothetical protein
LLHLACRSLRADLPVLVFSASHRVRSWHRVITGPGWLLGPEPASRDLERRRHHRITR